MTPSALELLVVFNKVGSTAALTLSVAALAGVMVLPTSVRSEAPAAYAAGGGGALNPIKSMPLPLRWLPSRGRECYGRGKYKNFCQGPRKAPLPHGDAAAVAERLGLGEVKTVSHLILRPPKPEWSQSAAQSQDHTLVWPVLGGKLWRGFGRVRRGPKRRAQHKGVDIGAPDGTPLIAARSGLVAYSDNGVRGYGNLLVVIQDDDSVAFYAHCRAIYVFPGQQLERGQIVGEVGHTGIARGSHLHFEYRVGGRPRDPVKLFVGKPD